MGAFLLIVGVVVIGFGMLLSFAGMMSSAPAIGDEYANRGCIVASIGLVSTIAGAAIIAMHLLR